MEHKMYQIVPMIKMTTEKMEKRINRQLKRYGVTFSQMRMVISVYEAENGTCSMKELEKQFQISQQSVAGIVSRLVSKDLLAYAACPSDKRAKYVRLTEKGAALGTEVHREMDKNELWMEQAVSKEELSVFADILQKINEHMDE